MALFKNCKHAEEAVDHTRIARKLYLHTRLLKTQSIVLSFIAHKVQRNIRSFRGDAKVSTWLYSVTRSECMNFLRKRSRQEQAAPEEQLDADLPDAEPGPDESLDRLRSARLIRALLDQTLDETERHVFTLHFGDDMPLEAITRLLGLENRSGAKAYIVSARRKLAAAVRRWRAGQQRLNA